MNSCTKVLNEELGIDLDHEKSSNLNVMFENIERKKASILNKCESKTKNDYIDSMLESDKESNSHLKQ